MKCKNCGNTFDGDFCNHCGQSGRVGRLTLTNFLEELSETVFQVNYGLFYTIKSLFTRPGHSIREYLDGKRKKYFKPIGYVLILSTLYFLISQLTETSTNLNDFLDGYSDGQTDGDASLENSPIIQWLSNNFAYTNLLLIPFFSFATYISFFGLGRNFLEHLVINLFISGQQAIFYALFQLVHFYNPDDNDFTVFLAVLVSFLFNCWAYIQLFSSRKKFEVLLRLILSYLLFLFFISLALFIFYAISTIFI